MNRQQRPRQGGRGGNRNTRHTPAQSNVPTTQQVIPGSSVSIVLKADQPTGREVQGVVEDLLTRGDHPRGIKVRLQDGRIGRVQRMVNANLPTAPATNGNQASAPSMRSSRARMPRDIRLDEQEEPPTRTLADFLPPELEERQQPQDVPLQETRISSSSMVTCPFCSFTGDEVAVSHHVDEHLG